MKNLFKSPYFYLVTAIAVGGGITTIVLTQRNRKRKEINRILDIVEKGEGRTGTIEDYNFSGSPFDSTYWRSNACKNRVSITQAGAQSYAKQIYDAKTSLGILGANMFWDRDDEGVVLNIFRRLKYKCDVSFLSYWFFEKYKLDLLTYLRFVDKDENKATLNSIINKLP